MNHPVLQELGLVPADLLRMPIEQQQEFLDLVDQYDELIDRQKCQSSFIDFCRRLWPIVDGNQFVEGKHIYRLCEALERVERGEIKRLAISMPPRHSKSILTSVLFPAYCLGRRAHRKIMESCNVKELAEGFGSKVRDLVNSPEYGEVFPDTKLDGKSAAKGNWKTTAHGEYYAVGVGGAMAGRGADISIIDDPHNEREAVIGLARPEIYDMCYQWYVAGPRQRLQPNGAIIIIQTRWSKRDLIGSVLKNDERSEWEVIEFPAILPSGRQLWPEMWTLEALLEVKADIGHMRWMAQYQQQPTAVELALVKPTDWIPWAGFDGGYKEPPRCTYIVQSWDTAHSKNKNANPSACTTWGLTEVDKRPAIVLLHAWQDRIEFPDLKAKAKEFYKEWKPDALIVESQASGRPLISELRTSGIPVVEFKAVSGIDKITRVNAVTDLFKSRFIYYMPASDTTAVVEQFAEFPAGALDDLVDSSTAALDLLKRHIADFRRSEADDEDDESPVVRMRMRRKYY